MLELQLHDVISFAAPPVISVLTTAVLHWFPGATAQHAITRYALGTAVTVGVPAAAMLLSAALGLSYGHLFWAALLLVNAIVSGATVNIAYWIDRHLPITLDDVAEAANAPKR